MILCESRHFSPEPLTEANLVRIHQSRDTPSPVNTVFKLVEFLDSQTIPHLDKDGQFCHKSVQALEWAETRMCLATGEVHITKRGTGHALVHPNGHLMGKVPQFQSPPIDWEKLVSTANKCLAKVWAQAPNSLRPLYLN